jgi:thiol-disulfide isomerase/thioredoxin
MIYNLHDPNDLGVIYQTIKTIKKPYLLFVHADWCPHCVKMQPSWAAFIEENINLPHSDNSSLFEGIDVISITDDVLRVIKTQFDNKRFTQVLNKTVKSYPTVAFVYKDKKNEDEKTTQVDVMAGPKTKETLTLFLQNERGSQ